MAEPDLLCAACGAASPQGKKFCGECGAAFVLVCPACGMPVEPGKKFCGECGAAVASAVAAVASLPKVSVPVAERRVCSVLFCDLVGFTPLSESRDPEEVRELLSRYFDTARTVIARYGGVVEKFIGDAVMAVWGTPVATEGDTERAVRAALDLVSAVAALGAEVAAPTLAARAGVVTGEVAVTLGASNEGMVAGDAVNTAARVQSAASAGTVLADETTKRLAQAAVGFEDAGGHELKGKSEPQQLWRASRVLSNVGGAQRIDGLEAPLTGRDVELRLLKDLFHATVDRRQPRLVSVSGPAGVGKSRLGWEFEKYIDGLAAVTAWHRGRCLSYGGGVAFWALAEIVRQRLGIAEEDPVAVAAGKLTDGVDGLMSDPAERVYVGVRLGRLLGLRYGEDAGQDLAREELFAGWRLFFERLAASDPVILLVEDVQYADTATLDFLDHLVDWAREIPILVVAFSRPELPESRSGWGVGRNRTLLALDPLDADSMTALLDALVPGMPVADAALIAGHAQGIPLFAVETIRSLIDADIVVPREGVYRLVGNVGTLSVPDSLHGLLAARLDSLEPAVRRLVADAAVLGSSFPAEALTAVSGLDEVEVRSALSLLLRREVLEISADPLSPQRGTYRFAHEMLRQVAYDTLSRRDRKAQHLAVAQHLRATFPNDAEEVVDVLARHYLDALGSVPDDPDADEIRRLAVKALIRAGERADRTGAMARAADSYTRAAELTDSRSGKAAAVTASRLWEQAAQASLADGSFARAVEQADRANAGYQAAGESRAAARAQTLTGRALLLWGRLAGARERLTTALATLRDQPDADTVAAMAEMTAVEHFEGGPDAGRLSDEALALGQELDVPAEQLAMLCILRGLHHGVAGRVVQAVAYLREADRLAAKAGDNGVRGRALLNLAWALGRDDLPESLKAAQTAADLLRHTGQLNLFSFAVANQASAMIALGDWDEARELLRRGIENDGLEREEFVIVTQAHLAALRGDVDEAEALLERVPNLLVSETVQDLGQVALLRSLVALARQRPADVLRHARQVLEHAETLGPLSDALRDGSVLAARAAHELGDSAAVHELLAMLDRYPPSQLGLTTRADRELIRARLAASTGEPGATPLMVAAIASLRAQPSPYPLAAGLLDHAGYLADASDPAGAAAAVDEARQIAGRLGAQPLLDRAERIVAGAGSPVTAAE